MVHPVTIIIPVHNGADFISSAFDTIARQAYEPLEIIVVDDGSTDETAALVQDRDNVTYIYQDNAGPASARNAGLRKATSEFITFLDIDDRYTPDKIQWQVERLTTVPDLDVVIGGIQYVTVLGEKVEIQHLTEEYDTRAFVNLGAAMFRRSVFDTVGLFAEDMRFSEDVDWFFRAMESQVNMIIYKKLALYYYLHGNSMTSQAGDARMQMNFLTALRRSVQRRRQPDGTLKPLPSWTDYMDDPAARSGQLSAWKADEPHPDGPFDDPPSTSLS